MAGWKGECSDAEEGEDEKAEEQSARELLPGHGE